MISVEFVKTKIDNLVESFPQLSCRYEFDALSNTHIIEVLPKSTFDFDEAYAMMEFEITNQFIDNYPDMSICFISTNSLISVENPIYEKRGILFEINNSMDILGLRTLNSISNYRIEMPVTINRIDIISPLEVSVYDEVIEYNHHGTFFQQYLVSELSLSIYTKQITSHFLNSKDIEKTGMDGSTTENIKYSFAA